MDKTTEAPPLSGPWLKWAWYHFSMMCDEFDTFEDAIAAAADADESLHAIEGPQGVVDPEHVSAAIQAWWDADLAARAAEPSPTHGVRLAAPRSEEKAFSWVGRYFSEEEAESAAEALRERFGDRVSVKAFG